MADFFNRSPIGLIEDHKKGEQDDRMNDKGIEQRASVFSLSRPRMLKKFPGRVNGKRKKDLSRREGGNAFFRIRSLRRG